MTRRPKAYVAALPLSALPELQDLLSRYCSSEAPRGNVLMVRLGDVPVARIDVLVEAGLFGSRSEAAAFLIGAGVDAQQELFERVGKRSAEIKKIRQALKQDALKALRNVMRAGHKSKTAQRKD
jgi:Arc/MetJ-type ribon-helix-helix transcriptional regulator